MAEARAASTRSSSRYSSRARPQPTMRGSDQVPPKSPVSCGAGGEAQVGGAGQGEPGAGAGAVDRGDRGLGHVVQEQAGALQLAQAGGTFVEAQVGAEVADRAEVASGAEGLARSGDDDGADRVVGRGVVECGDEGSEELVGHGVVAVGTVEGHEPDPVARLDQHGVGHRRPPPSILTVRLSDSDVNFEQT
ncbi:MAG: hypothetical protein ABS81_26895 [Pseudonocardia sp. SCN 72-86]|nr:MAG: hypothetical protein ABS81_26895 [Pseudonocardia sp. SCN 72-86]